MDIQELADHAMKFFEVFTRAPEDSHWKLKDRRPVWLKDLVMHVHDDGRFLPDDYKYDWTYETLEAIAGGADPEDGANELEADVYTSDLYEWLRSHMERSGYVDEATGELGHNKEMGIVGDIMMGQVQEKQEVWRRTVAQLEERLDEIDVDPDAPEEMEPGPGKKGGGRKQDWSPDRRGT